MYYVALNAVQRSLYFKIGPQKYSFWIKQAVVATSELKTILFALPTVNGIEHAFLMYIYISYNI